MDRGGHQSTINRKKTDEEMGWQNRPISLPSKLKKELRAGHENRTRLLLITNQTLEPTQLDRHFLKKQKLIKSYS
jgi:hypothetical protein